MFAEAKALGLKGYSKMSNEAIVEAITQAKNATPRITPESAGVSENPTVSAAVSTEDYLRPYQYRKGTKPGSEASDPQAGTKAERMKETLLKQPRVRILVPRASGEKKSIPLSVTLNGYRLDYPKNVYLDVPQQVADLIMDSQGQTEAAILPGQIEVGSSQDRALSR